MGMLDSYISGLFILYDRKHLRHFRVTYLKGFNSTEILKFEMFISAWE